MVSTLCVRQWYWSAKYGELGLASEADYEEECAMVDENRWFELPKLAFEQALH